MERGKVRFYVKGGQCVHCGEFLSAKNIASGEGLAIFDGEEGQIGLICLYHLTRFNPRMPELIGGKIISMVEHLVPLRAATHGRPSWHTGDCCDIGDAPDAKPAKRGKTS